MNLVNSSMFWGLLAVSIPIIIHILNRQRFKILDWAAIDLLRRALEKSRRRIKIQELILLLLRCLAVFCLVAFLMRPVPGDFEFGDRSRLRVVVIDNSASMASRKSGDRAWDRAVASAREVIKASEPKQGDRFMIFTYVNHPVMQLEVSHDSKAAFEKLDTLKLTHKTSKLDDLTQKIVSEIDKIDATTREVFVFSDFQASGLSTDQLPIAESERETWWHFHDCGEKDRSNLAVTRMSILSSSVVKDRPIEVEADVTNYSGQSLKTTVSLFDNTQKRDTKMGVEVLPGATSTVRFKHVFTEEGPRYLRIMIDNDGYNIDNNHYLGLEVRDQIKVVIVDGDPGSVNYLDESFFFRNMLRVPGIFDVKLVRKGIDPLDAIDFTNMQLLVLANIPGLSPVLNEKIVNWVREGGSLMLTGGPNLEEGDLGKLQAIMPMTIKNTQSSDPTISIGLTVGQHPEHSMLEKYNTLDLSRVNKLHIVEKQKDARVVFRAGGSHPIMVHRNVGTGQVVFWASSLDYDWCTFNEPDYIGVFGMTVQSLVQSVLTRITSPGQQAHLVFATANVGGDAQLKDSTPVDDESSHASGGRSALTIQEEGINAEIPVPSHLIETAGVYEVLGRSGNTLAYLGVNSEVIESDLEVLQDHQIIGKKENSYLSLSRSTQELLNRLSGSFPGREIWRYLAIAALLFLVCESFLAMKWGNR